MDPAMIELTDEPFVSNAAIFGWPAKLPETVTVELETGHALGGIPIRLKVECPVKLTHHHGQASLDIDLEPILRGADAVRCACPPIMTVGEFLETEPERTL